MTTEGIKRMLTRRLGEGSGAHRAGSKAAETVVDPEDVDVREDVVLGYGLDDDLYGRRS